ncbi:NAD-dependent epimerase/dehydratase family protein [Micromonospora sp. NPDC050980]|uniref:NAD-dependent epimerase/dehydratase family protein n=1 Tax=Micromonospora sp. NPDC050980 TaxID=3155161 RepID=UPI0033E31F9F
MRALVLGGAGFIGLHLVERLVADGHDVVLVDDFSRGRDDERIAALRRTGAVDVRSADLTAPTAWPALPRDVDHVYLLAAVVGVRNVEADPARVLRVNTLTAAHLVDWLHPGLRVFFSSTSEVYAGGVDAGLVPVPTPEDVPVMIADVASPRLAYAISKLTGEALLLHGARARGCSTVIGRFHNVYGPRMGADHVIPEMALRAMAGEDPFRIWGADQFRAFCHVDDAVEAVVRLMATPAADGRIVHIGNDSEQTNIGDLAKLVLRLTGVAPAVRHLPAPSRSVHRRCPDLGALRRLTGFEPSVPLEEGVRRTLDWYRTWRGPAGPPSTVSEDVAGGR